MSLYELVLNRRSTRSFTDQKLTPQTTEQLKKAALLAPTGKRKNHWDFVFVKEASTLEQLARSKPHGARLIENAALAVVVIGDPKFQTAGLKIAP